MIFLELFWTFFKIGAFTFGGGYAMLPLIQQQVILHGWLSEEAIVDFIAVSESTPGPFAINIATYVGSHTGGILGAVCATLGVVLPSFIIILIVAKCYEKFKESKYVKGLMSGLKPATVGLIAAALISMAGIVFLPQGFSVSVFKDISLYISLVILILSTFLVFKKKNPILVICLSAVIGIISGYIFNL